MARRLSLLALLVIAAAAGCAAGPRDTVFQVSTIDALLAGVYDGSVTCRALLDHGDLGIGTFDGLDGEMIVLGGAVYQVRADGKVYRPDLSVKTPFATVCRFQAAGSVRIEPGTDYEGVCKLIDGRFAGANLFRAVRIRGRFASVRTRSVPAQHKPYPPLTEVTARQPEFELKDVSGEIVGFRCPAYVKGVNVPGYHLHFISDDRGSGGHVLGFTLAEGTCEVDVLHRFCMVLPAEDEAFSRADLSKDRSRELNAAEKQ